MKKELLVPVGEQESLKQAVMNGADAVYLALKDFGARKYAKNFSHEELIDAVRYCHLYDVKVYVTLNTLIKDSEISSFLEEVRFVHQIGVDAVIMQDLGMMYLVHEKFPNLEIHASTQCHNYHDETLSFLKELGVKRAVLARELSLVEIQDLNVDIDLEVFIHGALCISYSGQCLFSSFVLNRSGNRGACAGMCRLPYQLVIDGKETDSRYFLSPKELKLAEDIRFFYQIPKVKSFKIEGRMKSPSYVGFITAYYRRILDAIEKNEAYEVDPEREKKLLLLFNRGFTKGHLLMDQKERLMNIDSPNHIGIPLGRIEKIHKKKSYLVLAEDLHQGDGIRFANGEGFIVNFLYHLDGRLIAEAKRGQTVVLETDKAVVGPVLKTMDVLLKEELSHLPKRLIPIRIFAKVKIGEPFTLTASCRGITVTETGAIVEPAKSSPVTRERLIQQLSKIKETPFVFETCSVEMDDSVFLVMSHINEVRRRVLSQLQQRLEEVKKPFVERTWQAPSCRCSSITPGVSVTLFRDEQWEVVKDYPVRVYTENQKLWSGSVIPRLSRLAKDYPKGIVPMIGEVGGCQHYTKFFGDYFLNVFNLFTVYLFLQKGAQMVTLSPELTPAEMAQLVTDYQKVFHVLPNVEVIIYGRIELMLLKHELASKNALLKDRNQELYPFLVEHENTRIFSYRPLDYRKELSYFTNISWRIDLFDESKEEISKLLKSILENRK